MNNDGDGTLNSAMTVSDQPPAQERELVLLCVMLNY